MMGEPHQRLILIARTAFAFLICLLLPGLLIGLLFLGQGGGPGFVIAVYMSAAIGYPATLIELPIHLFLRASGWTRLSVYVALGCVLATGDMVVSLLVDATPSSPGMPEGIPWDLLLLAVCGALAATAFWLLVRPGLAYGPKTPAAATTSAARPDG